MRRGAIFPYLAAAAIVLASVFGLVSVPAAVGAPSEHVDHVIVVGAAGLRWDDVSPTDTPNLWRLAQRGSIGALSVRSAHTPTCPADGWLTLGAGNYAVRTDPGLTISGECPPLSVGIQRVNPQSVNLPDQETSVADWNLELPYRTQPGALADALKCTMAVGPGAAIAAARPYGRVDRYQASISGNAHATLSTCPLSIVDLGTISGTDPQTRRTEARAIDRSLGDVLDGRPKSSLLLVAGLSDTDLSSRLHVAIADGPGYRGGWLTSSSTARQGYLQLIDLAPTTLNALDKPAPTELFAGQPVDSIPGRPSDLTDAVSRLSDADREADAQRQVAGGFFGVVSLAELALFVIAIPLLRRARRARRHAGRRLRPAPVALVRAVEVLLIAASLTVPGALVADAVPWWRGDAPGLVFGLVTAGVVGALTALVLWVTGRRGALGPLGAVGWITTGIVGIDVLTGSRLQLNGVAGYSAVEGARYAGLGTIGLGLFIAGILLASGWLAQRLARRWRPVAVAALGGVGVVLVGSPYLGSEAAGAIALTAGVCVAAAICTGGFLTFPRLAWATLTGLVVTTGFALLDLWRAGDDRGSLGRFVSAIRDGTGDSLVQSIGAANGSTVFTSPLTLVVLGSAAMVMFVLLRPTGGLQRLFGIYPGMRAALIGTGVASALAGFLDGVAFNVAGAAAATAVPLATLASLRVLDHADDRTIVVPPLGEDWVRPVTAATPVAAVTPAAPAGPVDAGPGERHDLEVEPVPVTTDGAGKIADGAGVALGVSGVAAGAGPGAGEDAGSRVGDGEANGDQPEADTAVSAPTAPVGDVLP